MKKTTKMASPIGGIQAAAELLNHLDSETRKKLLANLTARDPELVQKIEKAMVVFDDLRNLTAKELQILLRKVPQQTLTLALRTASEQLKNLIFQNLSARTGQMIRDAMEIQGPQRRSEVELAQAEIIRVARFLEEEGKIILQKSE